MYQQAWAVDGKVAVHLDGREECIPLSTRKAATRSRYYLRRTRPNGEQSDDIEASLAYVEDKGKAPLQDLIAGRPITAERKGGLAQLLALQMFRSPAFFALREELIAPLIEQLSPSDFKSRALAAARGDVTKLRTELTDAYLSETHRFMTMLTRTPKMATLLSHMRWQLLRFDAPLLAYSDHPVVVWPLNLQTTKPLPRLGFAPLDALEIRVPIAPDVAILMTWINLSDENDVRLGPRAAGELNALTVVQAERQWMHRLGSEPPVQEGALAPLSRLVAPGYDRRTALRSARRARAGQLIERVKHRQFVHDVEVLIESPAVVAPAA